MREHRNRVGLLRTRWAAVGAAVAVTLGAGGLSMAQAAIDTGDRPVTVTIAAERILDTRTDLGLSGRFADGAPRDLQVTGSVPTASGGSKNVVPTDAIGVLVNVTVVAPTHEGFLSLRPQGATGDPTTSTVNFVPGSIEPNAATVDLNDGKIQIWVETSSDAGSADVLIDVVGYTIGHTHDDRYYTEADIDAYRAANTPLFATIFTDGSVFQGISNGLVSSAKVSTGRYTITFERSVEDCSAVTSDWTFEAVKEISADVRTDANPNTVTVVSRNSSDGALTDALFNLVVQCPPVTPGATPSASASEVVERANPND